MTVTNDFQVFLNGCIKNNAVDYKVLYENKCKENEELKKQADAENTANMIDRLNQEYDELDDRHNLYVKEKQEYIDTLEQRCDNFYHLSQTLMMTLLNMNCVHNPGEEFIIGDNWNYNANEETLQEIVDDMNNDDWNGDDRQAQMELIDGNEIHVVFRDPDEITSDEEDSDDE